jgi:regulator of RNase E activity RraA
MTAGFRINARSAKVSDDMVGKFAAIPVANISDSMSRLSAGGASLRPLHQGGLLAGAAITVKTRPGDNLLVTRRGTWPRRAISSSSTPAAT